MIIAVTGSVCTGKTKVAKAIAKKLNADYIDVNKVIKENQSVVARWNKKYMAKEIDVDKLNKIFIEMIKKNSNIKVGKKILVIDSHLSHYLPKRYVDVCIVCKCDLKVLKKRLEKRGYSKAKIRENLNADIFDVCLVEALEKGHKVIIVDTSKKVDFGKLVKDIKGIRKV